MNGYSYPVPGSAAPYGTPHWWSDDTYYAKTKLRRLARIIQGLVIRGDTE